MAVVAVLLIHIDKKNVVAMKPNIKLQKKLRLQRSALMFSTFEVSRLWLILRFLNCRMLIASRCLEVAHCCKTPDYTIVAETRRCILC